MDPKELQRELEGVVLENQLLRRLFRQGKSQEIQIGKYEFKEVKAQITYTAQTHGGGSMVLGSLHEKLINLTNPPQEVLECFCGPAFLGIWAKLVYPGSRLTLIDLNPKVADLIKISQKLNKLNHIDFFCSDGLKNCPPRKFDLVLANPPWWPSLDSPELKSLLPVLKDNAPELTFLDPDFNLHRRFFRELKKFIHTKSRIFLLESTYHGPEIAKIATNSGYQTVLEPVELFQSIDGISPGGIPTWVSLSLSH